MKYSVKKKIISIFLFGILAFSFVCLFPLTASADVEKFTVGDKESYVFYKDGYIENIYSNGRVVKYGEASCIYIWISLMQLKEKGAIKLEEPVSQIIPKDVYEEFHFNYDFTILDLMNQTAGFTQVYMDRTALEKESLKSLKETLIHTVPQQPYEPGSYVAYSDWGNTLAAYIVECASGQSYPDYVKQNILKPLEMNATSVSYDLSDVPALSGVDNSENGVWNVFYPSDLAYGTIEDFYILLTDLVNEHCTILSRESVQEMFTPTLQYRGTEIGRIAHGFPIYYDYENPVYGYRVYNSDSALEFYITEDLSSYIIVATDNPANLDHFTNLPIEKYGQLKTDGNFTSTLGSMSGSYRKMSAVLRGKALFTSVLDTNTFVKYDEKTLTLTARKNVPYMEQISDYSFKLLGEDVGFFYRTDDGFCVIEFPLIDAVKTSRFGQVAKIALFIGYLTGGLYAAVISISAFFKFLGRIMQKGEKPKSKFRKYHLIQCGTMFVHVINFLMMALNILGGGSSSFVKATSFMFYIGTLISFVYIMFFARTGIRDKDATNGQRVAYYITTLYAILFIVFAFVFGLLF